MTGNADDHAGNAAALLSPLPVTRGRAREGVCRPGNSLGILQTLSLTLSRNTGRGDQTRRLGVVLLIVLLLTGIARAAPIDVIARGQDDRYWVCRVDADDSDKSTTKPAVISSVRELLDPVKGTWVEIARLGVRITEAAPLAERLAVLADDGDWRVLWKGGSVPGPVPPDGLTLTHLASENLTLWATAKSDTNALSLLKWTEAAGWSVVGPLPPDADNASASLGAFHGTAWLTWQATKTEVRVAHWDGRTWAEPVRPLARATEAIFVSGAAIPLLAARQDAKHLAVWRTDVLPPKAFLKTDAEGPFDVTMVGPSLRVVTLGPDDVTQTAFDDAGRGPPHGPTPIARPLPPAPRTLEWANVVVLAMLMAMTLSTLRPRPGVDMPVVTLPPGLRIAPAGRRLLAALIDASPVLVTAWWVFKDFHGTPTELERASTHVYLPLFLAAMAYLAHVTIAELKAGRSLGKWVARLRVVTLEGAPVPAERIVLRNLLRAIDLTLVPIAFVLVSPLRQRIGDVAAKTVVVADTRVTPPA